MSQISATSSSDDLEPVLIGMNTLKSVAFVLIGVAMVALSLFVAMMPAKPGADPTYARIIGWFGAAFFGLAFLVILRQALTLRGTVLTISKEGVKDARLLKTFIPWSGITGVIDWGASPWTKLVMIRLDPDYTRSVDTSRLARSFGRFNAMIGAGSLPINHNMLAISHKSLLETLQRFHDRYGGGPTGKTMERPPFRLHSTPLTGG
jgi:hypothetical protein